MSLDAEHTDLLAVCNLRGISWELVAREAQRAGSVSGLLRGEVHEKSRVADAATTLLEASGGSLDDHRSWVQDQHEKAEGIGARLVTVLDDDYPMNLRVIFNLPPFIYVLGSLVEADSRSVAVVGTRTPSEEGVNKAARMARLLAERGVTVVSGLAKGVDASAHASCLEAGGRTVAVMGTGILNRYPKENTVLADRIAAQGALISQFWPEAPPRSHNFPIRNVVTSGISQGTVVIEASSTSGAKMQARLAIQHGKLVFLLDSLVMTQPWARDYVARHGRRIVVVRSVDDVIDHLRSAEQVDELTSQRRQLAFDLA